MKYNIRKLIIGYLIVFGVLMLIYTSVNAPRPVSEWDDSTLPIASIINDHNFAVSGEDVEVFKDLYPEWTEYVEHYSLSGRTTRDGSEELAWYYPVYALFCVPFTLLLRMLDLPATYAFHYTNLALLMIALLSVYRWLDVDDSKKCLLILLLSMHPIVFYIGWISSEVSMYAMLIISFTFWYNQSYKRAAFFLSVAGMMNPTIMSVGIIMILGYCIELLKTKQGEESWFRFVRRVLPKLIAYGCCYVIGLVPMVYNYYHVGHINLTASYDMFTQGSESNLDRFLSYIFDMNYGFLPYFPVVLVLGVILLIMALVRKHYRYLQWILAFLANVFMYSIMIHINCGMTGIARYSAWGSVVLIFAVVVFFDDLFPWAAIKNEAILLLYGGVLFTGMIVFTFNPYIANNTHYNEMTPIAKWVLEYMPGMYNPLHSTFNCRVTNIDGGYAINTPIVYVGEDGYVRKILASSSDREQLLNTYQSYSGYDVWFEDKVEQLSDKRSYISIPGRYQITHSLEYELGTPILFSADNNDILQYAVTGLSTAEEWGTWTDGYTFKMRLQLPSDIRVIHAAMDCGIMNRFQDITIYINDLQVYHNAEYTGDGIEFFFVNTGDNNGVVEIRIEIPDAISPAKLGHKDNDRIVGLAFRKIVLSDPATIRN